MYKRILAVLSFLLALTLAIGVGQAKQTELNVWISDFTTDTQKWITEQFLPDFHAANPDIKVTVSYVGWGVFYEKLKVSFAAGTSPDIYQGGSTYRGQAGAQGTGMNIDKYTKNWPDRVDFFPASWESVVWNGHDYGIPTLSAPRTMIYRADLLAEGGFNPDINPQSWDDVWRSATKLSKVDGNGKAVRWGFNVEAAATDFFIALLQQNGGQFVTPDGAIPLFNTPEGYEAAQWYYDFYKAQTAFGGKVPAGNFGNGAYVMDFTNIKKVPDTIKANPDLANDMKAGYPMKRKLQVSPVFTDSFFMSSQTKNPDQAWEFLKFFAKAQNLTDYNSTLGYFPPRKSSMRSAFLEANPHLKDTFEKVMPFAVGRPSVAAFAPVKSALNDIFAGKATPQAALQNAVAAWTKF